jgi:hypothetical protein
MPKYKLSKMFSSRDGRLEPDDREYGMTQTGLDEIGDARPHLGGATHIFVKTIGGPSNSVLFSTKDNQHQISAVEKDHGWAEYGLEHGSGYNPDRGEIGWWSVRVEGAESDVVEGIGLPYSWHVSTFVVFEWVEENGENGEEEEETGDPPEIPEEPDERNLLATVLLYDDGSYELRNEAKG